MKANCDLPTFTGKTKKNSTYMKGRERINFENITFSLLFTSFINFHTFTV